MALPQPVGHWSLRDGASDSSGNAHHGEVHGEIEFTGRYGRFSGDGHLYLPRGAAQALRQRFTLSAWLRVETPTTAVLGDIACLSQAGRGLINLGFHHGHSTGSRRNRRNLFFGIDDDTAPSWIDHGRLGTALFVTSLAVHGGHLYAGTYEDDPDHIGRVYRLENGAWTDCELPLSANSVTALASHEGKLFAGTTRYRAGGSGLPDSPNTEPGGEIYALDVESKRWLHAGRLAESDSVGGFAVLNGQLYAIPSYTEGLFRLTGENSWEGLGGPGRRLLALGSYRDRLLGAGNDHVSVDDAIAKTRMGVVLESVEENAGGGVFSYSTREQAWTHLGLQPHTTQVYSFAVHQDRVHIGTWPNGTVFRHAGQTTWENCGRLGDEQEVMGMVTYNGTLYAGTVPSAAVFRQRESSWERVGTLEDETPVLYPRAASFAVFDGRLFVGTSPSGKVWSMSAGPAVSVDTPFPTGWVHVAAVSRRESVELYLNGLLSATTAPGPAPIADGDLTIGSGVHASFSGDMADVRIFSTDVTSDNVMSLYREKVMDGQ